MFKLEDIYCNHTLNKKLVNSGFKHAISAKDGFVTYSSLVNSG